jgi:hypothetical protein
MITVHSLSQIIRETIDFPSDIDWNVGLIYHTIINELVQQGLAPPPPAPRSPRMHMGAQYTRWNQHVIGGGGRYIAWNDPNMDKDA